ncbi:DnaJ DnaJ-class molecular chaperone protein [Pyrenophora teres f. maculata]|nr:DnaJ DnaJ-class molecular chaperone protein [Pyrenophora teres f. maculata]
MQSPTYYTTLGLAPNAPPEVIRAAYKALALIYHPDKTLVLPASERAIHAAVFRNIQEAFDVLSSQNVKAAYDAELERGGGEIDEIISTFHHARSSMSKPRTAVRLTTPEEKGAMIAQTRQQLDRVRMKRKKRHEDEASMNVAELNTLVRIWLELADENANDPVMKAHCHIRAYEYQKKIQAREREHEDWLEDMSKPKTTSATPVRPTTPTSQGHRGVTQDAPFKSTSTEPLSSPNAATISARDLRRETCPLTTPSSRTNVRAADPKRAEERRVEEARARAVARREKKAQTEAAKQARIEEGAALVRTEKDKQRTKVQEQVRLDAERIAKARAKVRATPIGTGDAQDSVFALEASQELSRRVDASGEVVEEQSQSRANVACVKCNLQHGGLREWKRCGMGILTDGNNGLRHLG